MFGAYLSEQLVSVIAARSEGTHITPIFRRCKRIPLFRPVYHKLGLHDIDMEQTVNSLRFTPMEWKR